MAMPASQSDQAGVDVAVLGQAPQIAPAQFFSYAQDHSAVLPPKIYEPESKFSGLIERASSFSKAASRHGPPLFSGRAPPIA